METLEGLSLRQVGGQNGMAYHLVATRVDDATYAKLEKGWTAMTWSMAELTRKILMSWDGDPMPLVRIKDETSPPKFVKQKVRGRG